MRYPSIHYQPYPSIRSTNTSENKKCRAAQAQRCPDVIELYRLPHDKNTEGDKDYQRHAHLQELQFRQAEHFDADAVRRNMHHVLEKGDSPTQQRGDIQGLGRKIFEMQIPRAEHEYVGYHEQQDGFGQYRQVLFLIKNCSDTRLFRTCRMGGALRFHSG